MGGDQSEVSFDRASDGGDMLGFFGEDYETYFYIGAESLKRFRVLYCVDSAAGDSSIRCEIVDSRDKAIAFANRAMREHQSGERRLCPLDLSFLRGTQR